MKITKELFKRMQKCCEFQIKASKEEGVIENELKDLGIDMSKLRNNDGLLVQFLNYGSYFSKKEIEEDLDRFVNSEDGE